MIREVEKNEIEIEYMGALFYLPLTPSLDSIETSEEYQCLLSLGMSEDDIEAHVQENKEDIQASIYWQETTDSLKNHGII